MGPLRTSGTARWHRTLTLRHAVRLRRRSRHGQRALRAPPWRSGPATRPPVWSLVAVDALRPSPPPPRVGSPPRRPGEGDHPRVRAWAASVPSCAVPVLAPTSYAGELQDCGRCRRSTTLTMASSQRLGHVRCSIESRHGRSLVAGHHVAVAGLHLGHHVGDHDPPLVRHPGGDQRHLQRGGRDVVLADGRLGQRAGCPRRPVPRPRARRPRRRSRSGTPRPQGRVRSIGGVVVEARCLGRLDHRVGTELLDAPSARTTSCRTAARIANSVPPQLLPSKLEIGRLVSGGV